MLYREIIYKQGYKRLLKSHEAIIKNILKLSMAMNWNIPVLHFEKWTFFFFKPNWLPQLFKMGRQYNDRMSHANEFLPGNDSILSAFISLEPKGRWPDIKDNK